MTVAFASLVATIGLSSPFGIVASSGAVVRAHGTQTGQDTQSYSVNFASLVPASGPSVTAYLAATITEIEQNPFAIVGPPQGHPSYNPNFVPTIGYATNVYSIALSAVTGGIDNINTFELFRTTLVSGQTSISVYNTGYQIRAADRKTWAAVVNLSGGSITPYYAQFVSVAGNPGLTSTLPLVSQCAGLMFLFANPTSGLYTIAASGSDKFIGSSPTSVSSLVIPSSGMIEIWADANFSVWQVASRSPSPAGSQTYSSPGTFNFIVPASTIDVVAVGGGGGSGGCENLTNNCGSPGGGGGKSIVRITGLTIGSTISVTVGGGGTAGLLGLNGGTGGTSSFGGYCYAGGGTGGQSTNGALPSFGGVGGAATVGDVNIVGGNGGICLLSSGTNIIVAAPGTAPGNPPAQPVAGEHAAATGSNPGDGAFAPSTYSGSAYNGAAGTAGYVYITW